MDRSSECAPDVTGVAAPRRPVAPPLLAVPSNAVPAPAAAVIPPRPVELTLTTLLVASNAKLWGAEIVEPDVIQSEVSSSATKASLYADPTKCGYSSERNLKLNVRQFAPCGTVRSIFRIETS